MAGFNGINRGVYIADNLYFLRAVNTESVDLVCIDPPFAKNETFGRKRAGDKDPLKPPLTAAERDNELRLLASWGIGAPADADAARINWPETAYKDFWSWENDIHEDWLVDLRRAHGPVADLINVARYTHSESVAAYLCYMAIRFLEIHRVLKPTGSLYLHCDHTANGYLRQLLDGVFGKDSFRNEIVWHRTNAPTASDFQLGCVHDTILSYAKTPDTPINKVFIPYSDNYVKKQYKYSDARGAYQVTPLTAQGPRYGHSGKPWHGIDVTAKNLHWIVPTAIPDWITLPEDWEDFNSIERLDWFDQNGLIYWPPKGKIPRFKRYLSTSDGVRISDVISDIAGLQGASKERTGYPTQKPVALAERLIAAASNPGDVVMDCFAGCAYVAVAAERLGRRWVACDIQPRAWTVFKRQFNKPQLALLSCHDLTTGQQVLSDNPMVTIHGPGQLPVREYLLGEGADAEVPPVKDLRLPEPKFKVPASIIPEAEMLRELLKLSGYAAWCCGFANRRADGRIIETTRNFHLDHIAPKSKGNTGTSNDIQNRAPLCPYHNIRKNNRRVGLAEYRQEIADAGELMVDTINELINLDYALVEANKLFGAAWARRYPVGV